ncbi:MAG: alkaline phosphatase family protein [Flavobacteriaceae bacterium]|nr:alkaline phosphatase family protein [Flavobacteriaceae bacterium]MBL6678705.1 alkaline phosphatase family protein [Flavobacteriaceae bacterium]
MKSFLIFFFFSISLLSQQDDNKISSDVKLVVGIVVDQMKYEYIPKFWNKYGEHGFKRLINNGFLAKNAHYSYARTSTGLGHATIVTGTTPSYHGIVGNDWYNPAQGKEIYCVDDNNVDPVGTTNKIGKKSPKNLLTTTVSDENRISSNFRAKTLSVSLKDRAAILSGGHTSNQTFWFSEKEGIFVSSSYYMEKLPDWLIEFNSKKNIHNYIDFWDTYYDIDNYIESGPDLNNYEGKFLNKKQSIFPYDLKKLSKNRDGSTDYNAIKYSPYGNEILKDLALKAIIEEELGSDDITDFVHIGFSSPDYIGHKFGSNSKEVQDTYIRLDRTIEEILNFLDNEIGLNNYVIYLSADHGITHSPDFLADNKIPINKILSSKVFPPQLNQYIKNISNYNIFLDKDKIVNMKEDIDDIKIKITNLLLSEPWIYDVYDFTNFKYFETKSSDNYSLNMLLNNSHPKYRGDLAFFVNPFWVKQSSSTSNHGTPTTYDTHVPIIFYGKNIKKGVSYNKLNVKDIAPTLATILGINFPILTTGKIIVDAIK